MLESVLRLYTMYMALDVRSPMPHLVGPPGCGKSTSIEQAAALLGVNLHIINVARLSPLEIEGVQMPVDMDTDERRLHMLLSTLWSTLKEGDIILMDEFLRGFPEVYNGLLDIFTSRQVAGHKLPKVFIIGASNSTVAYDPALEDRLLHLPVTDPRTHKREKEKLATILVDATGLLPAMVKSMEMQSLLDTTVLPMFKVLDSFKKGGSSAPTLTSGKSIRNLIGQTQLRCVQVPELTSLVEENNRMAMANGKIQYILVLDPKKFGATYPSYGKDALALPKEKLTPLQATNRMLNLQLLETEKIRNQKEGDDTDDTVDDDILSSF